MDESRPDDAPFEEGLDSEYVDGPTLDLALWARDSVAEVVPALVLCREDCAGLCPTCGANHNLETCDCAVEAVDPRWDALTRAVRAALGRPRGQLMAARPSRPRGTLAPFSGPVGPLPFRESSDRW